MDSIRSTPTTPSLALGATGNVTQGVTMGDSIDVIRMGPAVFFGLLGIFGNVAALVTLRFRSSREKSSAFYHLVKALAWADLIGVLVTFPGTLYARGDVTKQGGMFLCHYMSFALMLTGDLGLAVVLVMALERFIVVQFPFKYPLIVTHRNLNLALSIMWLVSALFASLPIMGFGKNNQKFPGTWCFFDYRDTSIDSYILNTVYAISGLAISALTLVLNTIVIRHVWRMRKSRLFQPTAQPSNASLKEPDLEMRMVLFLMTIIFLFTTCYSPFMVRVLINQFRNTGGVEYGGADDLLDVYMLRLAILNQIVDPWVYIFSRIFCCRDRSDRTSIADRLPRPADIRSILATAFSSFTSRGGTLTRMTIGSSERIASKQESELAKTAVPATTEFPEQSFPASAWQQRVLGGRDDVHDEEPAVMGLSVKGNENDVP